MRRRELLIAGAAALALPATAAAASDDGGLLTGLWRREMGAAFAYAQVLQADPMLALIRAHETHHAGALATEIGAVGLFTPPPPKTVADLDSAAERLATSAPHVLRAAIVLEEELVAAYKQAVPVFEEENIAMTAATILGSHAQHLLMLRRAAGVT
jgi:Ferritin-like domain